jgi:hypothetical protein
MDEKLQWTLLPFAKFSSVLQVRIGGQITTTFNIYINPRSVFSAHLSTDGMVHVLEYGGRSMLPTLFPELIPMPENSVKTFNSAQISIDNLGELYTTNPAGALSLLKNAGIKEDLAEALSKDTAAPICVGSAILLKISSEQSEDMEIQADQVGRGLLFCSTQERGWLFRFDSMKDGALGDVLPGSPQSLMDEVKRLLP